MSKAAPTLTVECENQLMSLITTSKSKVDLDKFKK